MLNHPSNVSKEEKVEELKKLIDYAKSEGLFYIANKYAEELRTILGMAEFDDRGMRLVDSRTIGIIGAKRNFNVDREKRLIEKAKTTKCLCFHPTGEICFYRTCRHHISAHPVINK